ncbi:MAG: lanthionine synthetase LanC family protein [Acidobacteriota bacterium]
MHDSSSAAALKIGRALCQQADWSADRCSWRIRAPQATGGERASSLEPASGELYQGNAGIALFLGELFRATGDPNLARAARGGMVQAITQGHGMSAAALGFHSGRTGVAWAAARVAEAVGAEELSSQVVPLLAPIADSVAQDRGLDVIAGAAGAIPALIDLASGPLAREAPDLEGLAARLAVAMGDHLLRSAHREPDAWSWTTLPVSACRNLAGFAHGTAGLGLALLELAHVTGRGDFRFAAEMAFLYERRCYDPLRRNWPDWRNMALGDMYQHGQIETVRQLAKRGSVPPYEKRFMTAWCHGSPGLGLSRLRALELTGQETYRREAEAALESTALSLDAPALEVSNFSLCHGAAGNAELPLHAARLGLQPSGLELARRVAAWGLERYDVEDGGVEDGGVEDGGGAPWPTGTLGGGPDPSLMLGDAGIGLFLLRLSEPSTPTPLLVRPEARADSWRSVSTGESASGVKAQAPTGFSAMACTSFKAQASDSARDFFAATLDAWKALDPAAPEAAAPDAGPEPLERSPAALTFERLEAHLESASGARAAALKSAYRPERRAFLATREIDVFYAESLRALVRSPWPELDLETARFAVAADGELLVTAGSTSGDEPTPWLLARSGNRVRPQRVGQLAGVLLEGMQTAGALDLRAAVGCVAAALGEASEAGAAPDAEVLRPLVTEQLEQLYGRGLIDALGAPAE